MVVGGESSEEFVLSNMVFQGTVWGPPLWNIFYEDARRSINEFMFKEIVFVDDLNAYKVYTGDTGNKKIVDNVKSCQKELYEWGKANQVKFDLGKESFHIVSSLETYGGNFKLLGISFDTTLSMKDTIEEVVVAAGWKIKMLVRSKRYYTDAELAGLYKAHLLSYLEYRTSAIYHAKREELWRLDRVQKKFLEDIGIDELTAIMEFNLAPLEARRDMAI